jgi:antitoxin PrlF
MSQSRKKSKSESRVVQISERGQATIPKKFREKIGLTAPGRVEFREEDGEITIHPIQSPEEMRGFIESDGKASQRLRQERAAEADDRDQRFEESG